MRLNIDIVCRSAVNRRDAGYAYTWGRARSVGVFRDVLITTGHAGSRPPPDGDAPDSEPRRFLSAAVVLWWRRVRTAGANIPGDRK